MSAPGSATLAGAAEGRPKLLPLFLVALASVGYEIALTRWFAIVSWSEYGYWVISITMVGIAASGVVLNLAKDWLHAHPERVSAVLAALPSLLVVSLAGGYLGISAIDFNPLALQNHATMGAQLWRIAGYYAALFPFFFLSGAFIGLYFIAYGAHISRIYAADLVGAGAAGAVVVALMYVLHPFDLPLALVPVLFVAGWLLTPARARPASPEVSVAPGAPAALARLLEHPYAARVALVMLTLGGAASVWGYAHADYNEYKAIAAPLRVEGNKRIETVRSPRGVYEVLDNFTERLDVDLSNNDAMLAGAEPIATYGLYADGNRITSLPKRTPGRPAYLNASLDALPYRLAASPPAVLLIGSRGGFRLDEAQQLGARSIVALEPEPVLHELIGRYRPDLQGDARRIATAPSAYLRGLPEARFDLIDIALDYQGSGDIGKYSFTVQGLARYHDALTPTGLVSVPVPIREFTVYAVKLVLTAREALRAAGVAEPARHIVVYRSAWNARILLSKQPFDARTIEAIRRFCEERSFDTAYLPGVDLAGAKIWNDLPPVSFEEVSAGGPGGVGARQDALANEIKAYVLPGDGTPGKPWPATYDLSPATTDRPQFHSVLRLSTLAPILARIDLVPREEIGALVSLAVLAQSIVIALLVLSLPLFRPRTMGMHRGIVGKSVVYFAGIGLGFLFIEIYLIEKATYFLNDRTMGFSLALAAMLIFSGLGSWLSDRYTQDPEHTRRGLRLSCGVIIAWCAFAWLLADRLLPLGIALPLVVRIVLMLLAIAPVGIALGFPFACGLSALRTHPHFVPWAWSLNGAFSVIASPLAHLTAMGFGNRVLVAAALVMYALVSMRLPLATARVPRSALAGT
ncbi:MAG: hypothetical protein HZC37_21350 [Burkholderiales bacterium]|nr:hypothetical protein [Burkholderiales bacterium]